MVWFWARPCSPIPPNKSCKMHGYYCIFNDSEPALAPNKSWKMHAYYCIFSDSEPAHAGHPTEQIIKNAWILLYFQWFWARPCSPSHRTNHENVWILLYFQWLWARPCCPSHRTNHENVWILLYFQWFWARPCSPSHRTNNEKCMDTIVCSMILSPPMPPIPPNKSLKMHGYYYMFTDSEPAHAPHPTEQIMKNAWILLYFQWLWARPCSPSHRTNHEKCMETIEFAMFLARPCSPLHDTNHAKYATEISRNNAFVMDYNVFQSLGVAEYYESCWKMGWCWKIVTWFKPKCHQVF